LGRRRQREYGADFVSLFEFPASAIQELNRGARRSPLACIEIVMTARATGPVQHAIGMKATSAAKLRNGAKSCLTAEENRRMSETPWTGEHPLERRMRTLPSVARLRLMRPPATLSRVATRIWLAGCVRESARSSYFRRKCGKLSALQQV
jgi:hypothetical protein